MLNHAEQEKRRILLSAPGCDADTGAERAVSLAPGDRLFLSNDRKAFPLLPGARPERAGPEQGATITAGKKVWVPVTLTVMSPTLRRLIYKY